MRLLWNFGAKWANYVFLGELSQGEYERGEERGGAGEEEEIKKKEEKEEEEEKD